MKTESRKEVLDRLNEIHGDNMDSIRDYEMPSIAEHAIELLKLANAQEVIIEKMKAVLPIAKKAIYDDAVSDWSDLLSEIDGVIALADAPYGGER